MKEGGSHIRNRVGARNHEEVQRRKEMESHYYVLGGPYHQGALGLHCYMLRPLNAAQAIQLEVRAWKR